MLEISKKFCWGGPHQFTIRKRWIYQIVEANSHISGIWCELLLMMQLGQMSHYTTWNISLEYQKYWQKILYKSLKIMTTKKIETVSALYSGVQTLLLNLLRRHKHWANKQFKIWTHAAVSLVVRLCNLCRLLHDGGTKMPNSPPFALLSIFNTFTEGPLLLQEPSTQ